MPPVYETKEQLRADIALARSGAITGVAIGLAGIVIAIGFLVVYAGLLDAPAFMRPARSFFLGLGALALLLGIWALIDQLPRARALALVLENPDAITVEPATLRRQPAARLRLADGSTVVIPTSERLPRGGGER